MYLSLYLDLLHLEALGTCGWDWAPGVVWCFYLSEAGHDWELYAADHLGGDLGLTAVGAGDTGQRHNYLWF